MGSRRLRSLVLAVASTMLFACSDSDVEGLDAGPRPDGPLAFDAAIDAPVLVADAGPDASPPDAPPAIDALITDAFFVGDAGLKAQKAFRFTVDFETINPSFTTPGATLAWNPSDGDPAGSLRFNAVKTTEEQGTVKGQTPFFTWQDWGVPAGAQVVYVGITSYKRRLEAVVNMDHYWAFEIVGDFGESVHDGEDDGPYLEIASLTNVPQPEWETVNDLPMYEVKPLYRASNTRLHIKVWWFPIRSGAIDWRLDELELEVVYIMP